MKTDPQIEKKPATVEEQIKLMKPRELDLPVRAIFDADLFMRAYATVSNEETRYYLSGVHVEKSPDGGVLLVSTDGHRLLCFRDPRGFFDGNPRGEIIRALPHFRRMVANPRKVSVHPSMTREYKLVVVDRIMALVELIPGTPLDNERDRAALFQAVREPNNIVLAVQTCDVLIDGTYPDWRRVVPAIDYAASVAAFNNKMLGPIVKALGRNHEVLSVRLVAGAPKNVGNADHAAPVLVRVANPEIDGFGIIMPMRSNLDGAMPDWTGIETVQQRDERVKRAQQLADTQKAKADKKIADMQAATARTRKRPTKKVAKPVATPKKPVKKVARRRAA